MSNVYIDTKLKDDYQLDICQINALIPRASSYSIAIIQPLENVVTNDDWVKNENHERILEKYNNFFINVNRDNRELVLSPEYSCPWASLKAQFENNFPKEGYLWVLGCESIKPSELEDLKNEFNDIQFIYEEIQVFGDRNFLDPIVYCFNSIDVDGNVKKTVVVEFKKRPMVDHFEELEKDHLILGTVSYTIRNNSNSIYLKTLICAEAIDFDFETELDPSQAYIIPHLQLNNKPFHESFMGYRPNTFKKRSDIEYICVNWAQGFKIDGSATSKYGGSSIYIKSDFIKNDDERINENHRLGVYYSYATGQQYHRFTLNYNEHIFYLKNNQILQSKTSIINQKRHGIEAKKIFNWDSTWIETQTSNDRWEDQLRSMGFLSRVSFLATYKPMTKERFMSLTSGGELSKSKWYESAQLDSFHLDTDEKPKKLSVFFDSRNRQNLNEVTSRIYWLKRDVLSNDAVVYPARFSELQNIPDFFVNDDKKTCHVNIAKEDGKSPATFVGLQNVPFQSAKIIFNNIADAIGDDQRQLIVWYEDDDRNILNYCNETIPKIDDDMSESKKSIAKNEEEI